MEKIDRQVFDSLFGDNLELEDLKALKEIVEELIAEKEDE